MFCLNAKSNVHDIYVTETIVARVIWNNPSFWNFKIISQWHMHTMRTFKYPFLDNKLKQNTPTIILQQ